MNQSWANIFNMVTEEVQEDKISKILRVNIVNVKRQLIMKYALKNI